MSEHWIFQHTSDPLETIVARAGLRALVLHSGGLDSTVCLHWAMRAGRTVTSMGIDYGQPHRIEMRYAARQCEGLGIERRTFTIAWDTVDRPLPRTRSLEQIHAGGVSPAFLPGRNLVFFALAAAEAAGIGADEIWVGINAVDYSGYPDCRPEFARAFSGAMNAAIPNGPRLVAPLLRRTKPEIARLAHGFGIGKDATWSCYAPQPGPSGARPCGACDACVLHEHAWAAAALAPIAST